jgi:hypothetical protein
VCVFNNRPLFDLSDCDEIIAVNLFVIFLPFGKRYRPSDYTIFLHYDYTVSDRGSRKNGAESAASAAAALEIRKRKGNTYPH